MFFSRKCLEKCKYFRGRDYWLGENKRVSVLHLRAINDKKTPACTKHNTKHVMYLDLGKNSQFDFLVGN